MSDYYGDITIARDFSENSNSWSLPYRVRHITPYIPPLESGEPSTTHLPAIFSRVQFTNMSATIIKLDKTICIRVQKLDSSDVIENATVKMNECEEEFITDRYGYVEIPIREQDRGSRSNCVLIITKVSDLSLSFENDYESKRRGLYADFNIFLKNLSAYKRVFF